MTVPRCRATANLYQPALIVTDFAGAIFSGKAKKPSDRVVRRVIFRRSREAKSDRTCAGQDVGHVAILERCLSFQSDDRIRPTKSVYQRALVFVVSRLRAHQTDSLRR